MKQGDVIVLTREADTNKAWRLQDEQPRTEDVDGVVDMYARQGFDVIVAEVRETTVP